jgi:hypothetical protein
MQFQMIFHTNFVGDPVTANVAFKLVMENLVEFSVMFREKPFWAFAAFKAFVLLFTIVSFHMTLQRVSRYFETANGTFDLFQVSFFMMESNGRSFKNFSARFTLQSRYSRSLWSLRIPAELDRMHWKLALTLEKFEAN